MPLSAYPSHFHLDMGQIGRKSGKNMFNVGIDFLNRYWSRSVTEVGSSSTSVIMLWATVVFHIALTRYFRASFGQVVL